MIFSVILLEEHCPSADERLNVSDILPLVNELRLSAYPFLISLRSNDFLTNGFAFIVVFLFPTAK